MRAFFIAVLLAGCAAPGTYDNAPVGLPDNPQTVGDALALLESFAGIELDEGDKETARRVCDGLRLRALAGFDAGTVPWRVWCEAIEAR